MMKNLCYILTGLCLVACSAPVTFTFPGSEFEIKSHSYSEGLMCELFSVFGQGGGSCEHYYDKLYFKDKYLDLYAQDKSGRDRAGTAGVHPSG
jgi:hypothetical protein